MIVGSPGPEPEDTLNETFNHNLESHHATVFRYIYRMIGDWEEAQDLTQEAFTRWAAHDRPLTGPDANRRWLFVVARNLAFSHLRARSRDRRDMTSDPAKATMHVPSPRELESLSETACIVADAIRELPPDMREMVVLREYESMTYDEIAHITGTALGTVKSRLARARAVLRKKLAVTLEVER
jgi:RNA polymerase sigma-70 factor (ECF subfamily)